MNHHAAFEPRVHTEHLLKSLAEAALKNIPGSRQIIEQAFAKGPIVDQHRILPNKPMNQVFHGPY